MGGHMTAEEIEHQFLEVMGLDLGGIFYRLKNECTWLHRKWGNYQILYGTNPKRIDLLNSAAPAFFKMIQDVMWEDVLLHICRLIDPPRTVGKENLTLQCLPNMVVAETQSEVAELLALAKCKCDFAIDWRNRHIAHRDLGLVLEKGARPLAEASRRSVIVGLEAIGAVLNAVEFRYTGSRVGYEHFFPDTGEAESLLYVLRDGVEAEAARRERWRSGQAIPEDFITRPDI
jgi:hypothetical protein